MIKNHDKASLIYLDMKFFSEFSPIMNEKLLRHEDLTFSPDFTTQVVITKAFIRCTICIVKMPKLSVTDKNLVFASNRKLNSIANQISWLD